MGQTRFTRSNMWSWWAARNLDADLSGNLRNLAPGVQPSYLTGPNGVTVWSFDGAASQLNGPAWPAGAVAAMNIFVGFKVKSVSGGNPAQARHANALIGNSIDAPNEMGIALIDVGGASPSNPYQFSPYCSTGEQRAQRFIALNTWYVGILAFSGGVLYGGLEPFNFNANSGAPATVNFLAGSVRVGASAAAPFADVEISEILIYTPLPVGSNEVSDGIIWNSIASRILRRGDPEEQVRDLITRKALVAERLAYAPKLKREFLNTPIGVPLAITHRQVFTAFGPSGVLPSERYESLVTARALNLDDQTVAVQTAERPRTVAYASARADRFGSDMDGALLMGARLAASCPKPGIFFDALAGLGVQLPTSQPKMDLRGWYCESGGGTTNSGFIAAVAAPWAVAGGASFAAYPANVVPLFDASVRVAGVAPRDAIMPPLATVTLTVPAIVAGMPGFWLRFHWIGAGTVQVNSSGVNRRYDFTTMAWVTSAAALPVALPGNPAPNTLVWQEFVWGWIPADGANTITVRWTSNAGNTMHLGYASATRNLGITVADATAGDWAGQEGNGSDDVNRFYFPLPDVFASDGSFRFRFIPRWDYRRIGTAKVSLGRISRANAASTTIASGDPLPAFIFAYDPALSEVQLLSDAGAVLAAVSVAGADSWTEGVAHVVSLGWSTQGIEGFAADTMILYVDTRPSAAVAFGGPFAGAAPWIFSAELATTHAAVPPCGIYSDFLATSRPSDAVRRRVVDPEAL
jgi:hypothetical protein